MTAVPRWETVEKVAKALAAADRNDDHHESVDCFYAPPWEDAGETERNYWRRLALAALDVPTSDSREQALVEAARLAKRLVDPDREPHRANRREQVLAMRDVASDAWGLLADALRPYENH